jgi:hypothetical protein
MAIFVWRIGNLALRVRHRTVDWPRLQLVRTFHSALGVVALPLRQVIGIVGGAVGIFVISSARATSENT